MSIYVIEVKMGNDYPDFLIEKSKEALVSLIKKLFQDYIMFILTGECQIMLTIFDNGEPTHINLYDLTDIHISTPITSRTIEFEKGTHVPLGGFVNQEMKLINIDTYAKYERDESINDIYLDLIHASWLNTLNLPNSIDINIVFRDETILDLNLPIWDKPYIKIGDGEGFSYTIHW